MSERQAGWIGISAGALFWVALFTFAAARTDYDHLHKAVSELGVWGAPHALAWNLIGFIVPGILLALSGAGLAMAIDGRRGALWYLLVLPGLCFAGTGVVPGEMYDGSPVMDSAFTQGHLLFSNLALLLWICAAFLVIRRVKRNPQWQALTTRVGIYAALCVGGALVSIVASAIIPSLAQMPGLAQRIVFAFYFGWFLLMSLQLCSAVPHAQTETDTAKE